MRCFLFKYLLLITSVGFSQTDYKKLYNKKIDSLLIHKDTLNATRTYYKLAKLLDKKNKIEESNIALKKGIYFSEKIKNYKANYIMKNYLASNYSQMGEYDSSIIYYEQSLNLAKELKDSLSIPKILVNLGDQFSEKSEFEESVKTILEAIKILEQLNKQNELTYYYQKLGGVFQLAGNFKKWKEYNLLARSKFVFNDDGFYKGKTAVYNDLGGIAQKENNLPLALAYYDSLYLLSSKYNYTRGKILAQSNKAIIHKKKGDFNKAILLLESLDKLDKLADSYHKIFYKNLFAELYVSTKQYKKAEVLLKEIFKIKGINLYTLEKLRALETAFKLNKEQEKFSEAIKNKEAYHHLKDSLDRKEQKLKMSELEFKYQSEKKHHQIELLKTENQLKKQKNQRFLAYLIALALLFLSFMFFFLKRKKNNELKQLELQQKLLRSQMNPHFLFNALGSIQSYMYKNDGKKAANYLNNFASLTRSILEQSSKDKISLEDEILNIKNYLSLEQMRMNHSFDFDINFSENLDIEFIKMPPMILQPFVENAVKHGVKNINYKGEIKIAIKELSSNISVTVLDNGIGINKSQQFKEKNNQHTSKSMKIFLERKLIYEKKYGKKIEFKIIDLSTVNSNSKGTQVNLIIPIIE